MKAVLTNAASALLYEMPVSEFAELLRKKIRVDCKVVYPKTDSIDELKELVKDADVIIRGATVGLSKEVLEVAKQIKLVQATGAGLQKMPLDYLKERNIPTATTSGSNAIAVAEEAMLLVLMAARKAVTRHNLFREGRWERSRSMQLDGKTLGIIGLGHIGVEIAKRANAFGMHVQAIKRRPSKPIELDIKLDFLGGPEDLPKVLKASDFVVLCVPSTPDTLDMIGEEQLRVMKKTAFIINVGRGDVINEHALYHALTKGWISGAALDVWWSLPPDQPSQLGIHRLENVIASPHVAGQTDEFIDGLTDVIASNIEKVANGEAPLNIVDFDLGY